MMSQMQSEGYPQYSEGYEPNQSATPNQPYTVYDDNFVEALSQRIVQRLPDGSQGKLYTNSRQSDLSKQRLVVTIVSLVVLIPLAGILVGGVGGIGGLIAFVVACIAILSICATFIVQHR
jgi:hypothetical protein